MKKAYLSPEFDIHKLCLEAMMLNISDDDYSNEDDLGDLGGEDIDE